VKTTEVRAGRRDQAACAGLEEIRERKRVASSKLTHYSKRSLTAEIAQLPPWPSFSHQ
jgi:hypothetical protein